MNTSTNHRRSAGLGRRRLLAAAAGSAASAVLMPAFGNTAAFPSKPIELLVPFPTGSGSDIGARYYAAQLTSLAGQPVVVRNVPGGNGFIAVSALGRAAPDGHTILIGANSLFVINAVQFKQLPYDPVRDFSFIGLLNKAPCVLAVNGASPFRDLKSFVERARSAPGQLSSATGAASYQLFAAYFYQLAGIKLNNINYKGASEVAAAVAANTVDCGVLDPGSFIALAEAQRLRVLAVASDKRLPKFADAPTFAEAGFPAFMVSNWAAAAVPSSTPAAVASRLGEWFQQIAASQEASDFFARTGNQTARMTPDQLRKMQTDELATWRSIARDIGMQQE
ncbi:tripartite tricarboxylate transporter substrate binding protein [Variovorax sp. KK3]|uniref:Bug family tripartite tricarboxylate transporter substrate binding protein n=1 Tax=Variovorax sp. KK3 TaxID=1855728 RepID=UPI0015C315B7|nr:tripartite tricarboxylate transporter substrate binding protein [Variovorax sp. KK3]